MRNVKFNLLFVCAFGIDAPIAYADIVQGSVQPAGAQVLVKDEAGQVVAQLAAGPFQLQLAAGQFVAECLAPTPRTITFFSLSVPTSVTIDCT